MCSKLGWNHKEIKFVKQNGEVNESVQHCISSTENMTFEFRSEFDELCYIGEKSHEIQQNIQELKNELMKQRHELKIMITQEKNIVRLYRKKKKMKKEKKQYLFVKK